MVATVGYTKFKRGAPVAVFLKTGQWLHGVFVWSGDGAVCVDTEWDGRMGRAVIPKQLIRFMRRDGS